MKFSVVHTNITVENLAISMEFYEKAFGMKEVRHVNGPEGAFELSFMETEEGGHRLELTWFKGRTEADAYRPSENQLKGGFIPHMCFTCEDFEAARAFHREMGIVCLESEMRGVYFVKDPDGYWVEMIPAAMAYARSNRNV